LSSPGWVPSQWYSDLKVEIQEQQAEIERLREALAYYTGNGNWDAGGLARKTLAAVLSTEETQSVASSHESSPDG